jgi:hypothetical protein
LGVQDLEVLVRKLLGFMVRMVAGNAFSKRRERRVQALDIFADRSAAIPLGDIPMDGISRGDRLRSDPF